MASLVVIAAYLAVLWLILFPPSQLQAEETDISPPWWRNVRFWATVVVAAQVTVYALWG